MKRVVTAAILLAAIICLASYSLHDLRRNVGELKDACGETRAMVYNADDRTLSGKGRELLDMWNEKEARFVLYIQHDNLDHLTQEFSKLASMAEFGDMPGFSSTLDAILALLDDVERSAIPGYRNLL